MSIQNNSMNIFNGGGPVKQTASFGNNAISKQAEQTSEIGNNAAFSSQAVFNALGIRTSGNVGNAGNPSVPITNLENFDPGTQIFIPELGIEVAEQGTSITQTNTPRSIDLTDGINLAVGYQTVNQKTETLISGINKAFGTKFDDQITQEGKYNYATTGDGNDVIVQKGTWSYANAGDGDDTIKILSGMGFVSGGNGDDTLILSGQKSDWNIKLNPSANVGNAGNPLPKGTISYQNKTTGDVVDVRDDIETVQFADEPPPVTPPAPTAIQPKTVQNNKGGNTTTVKQNAQGKNQFTLDGGESANDVLRLYGGKKAWTASKSGEETVYTNKKTGDVINASNFEQVKFLGAAKKKK